MNFFSKKSILELLQMQNFAINDSMNIIELEDSDSEYIPISISPVLPISKSNSFDEPQLKIKIQENLNETESRSKNYR